MTLVRYEDTLITPPLVEPIDLEFVKQHLRFSPTTEDTLIDLYISMARHWFEEQTGLQLITATWARTLDARPSDGILLPRRPVQAVISISSDNGSPETVMDASGYRVVTSSVGPGRVEWTTGSWPGTRGRVVYTAGYGDAPGDVPELIRGALLMLVGHYHKFRAEGHQGTDVVQIPMGVDAIMRSYRLSSYSSVAPMRTA